MTSGHAVRTEPRGAFVRRFMSGRSVVVAAFVINALLVLATDATKPPWCDEAWFASPALNLATHGYMGTSVLDPASSTWKQVRLDGIDRYTYWVMPLYLVTQAGWYKLAGFGMLRMRLPSLAWAALALLCWREIAARLSGSTRIAGWSVLLLAVDYQFVMSASDGRMDMMCAALGAAGLAAFLRLRTRDLTASLFFANACIAAAVFTHPNGVLYAAALAAAAAVLDWHRLRWRNMVPAALPYAAGATLWLAYILKAPHLFGLQFVANMSGRGPGITAPWEALKLEIRHRYLDAFGMAAWSSPAAHIAVVVLLAYASGLVAAASVRALRNHSGCRVALGSAIATIVIFWGFEGLKTPFYLLHLVPWLCVLVAFVVDRYQARATRHRWALGAVLLAVIAVQFARTAAAVAGNSYRKEYVPAAQFLTRHARPSDLTIASAELAFYVGFDWNVLDDIRMGYNTGKRAAWIVMGPRYRSDIEAMRQDKDLYAYVTRLLGESYDVAYRGPGYLIYRLRTVPSG